MSDHERTPPREALGRQQPVELILLRQLADLIPTAMFLTDGAGQLLYYNQAGASLAGVPFDEARPCRIEACTPTFMATDSNGGRIPDEDLPIFAALRAGQSVHHQLSVRTQDGIHRSLGVTAIPIHESGGTELGVVAICWETEPA